MDRFSNVENNRKTYGCNTVSEKYHGRKILIWISNSSGQTR